MKRFSLLFALTLTLGACNQQIPQELPDAEVIFSSEEIIPGNLAQGADGTLYVTINPLLGADTKLYAIANNEARPYPNAEVSVGDSSLIEGAIGVRMDSQGNLWVLDMVQPAFVVWNTLTNELLDTLPIPAEVIHPHSFLQDFVVDEANGRIIVADMTLPSRGMDAAPAFIVFDIMGDTVMRIAESHLSLLPDVEGGLGLNPIAIDPQGEWVYFGALHGDTIFRAPAASFASEEMLLASIEPVGEKSFSDGIAVDGNGNIYITNVEDNAIAVLNENGFFNIAALPEGQTWADGLFVGDDGYLYATVSQLDRSAAMNNGENSAMPPFVIVRTPLIE